MPTIAKPGALLLRDVILTIGADSYQKQVSEVTITPSTSAVTWQGLSPDATVTEQTPSTWTVTLNMAQDWQDEDSLCNYLLENEGELVSMTFQPKAGGTSFAVANVAIVPPTIGGAVGTQPTASVTMGCDKPVRTFAP